jgi:hypothetical protein
MFDSGTCATMVLGQRMVSTPALREVRKLLDELLPASPTARSGRVASEGSNEQSPTQADLITSDGAPNGARVRRGSAVGRERACGGSAAGEPSPSSRGASAKQRKGGKR